MKLGVRVFVVLVYRETCCMRVNFAFCCFLLYICVRYGNVSWVMRPVARVIVLGGSWVVMPDVDVSIVLLRTKSILRFISMFQCYKLNWWYPTCGSFLITIKLV